MLKNTTFTLPALLWLSLNVAQAQTPPSIAPNSWGAGTPMPTARQGPFTGAIGNKIYVVGGITNTSVVNVNEIYDTTNDTWSTGAPMPTARWLAASAVVNNILYTIGGRSAANISLSVVEAYDPASNTWSTKAPMPIVNDNIYAAIENNIIYVIGGFSQSSQQRLTTVLSYNPATNAWSTLTPLKVGKSESAVGLLGSTIVSAGGLLNSDATTTDTEGYNAATNSWTTLAPMPTSRQASCFGVTAGLFYVAGGASAGGIAAGPLSVTEAYNPATNSWTSGLPSMPNAIVSPGSAIVGGRLYCFGGSNNGVAGQGAVHNYVQIYQPALSAPAISSGGVVSAGAFGGFTSVSPGSWIEIYGSNLAVDSRSWAGTDFNGINAPTSLDGTSVIIGGQSAYIDFIGSGQVNALVPSNVGLGLQQITVTTPAGVSAPYNITVNAVQPGLLAPPSFNVSGIQYATALFADGTYVLPAGAIPSLSSRPAKPGETIVLYGVGFGPAIPAIPAGQIVQQSNSLATGLQMFIGGAPAAATYMGLAPNFTGLYQFNLTVPNLAAGNAVPLTFTLGSVSSMQTLYIAVGN
jgi:uncharacterized protein (TIGR03437 family)